MFIFADRFFEYLRDTRSLWIRGALGRGKTLLSVALADHFLLRGWIRGVYANFPVKLCPPDPVDGYGYLYYDSMIILDELWREADARDFSRNDRYYAGFARKIRSIWLYPSVTPLDSRLRSFFVERVNFFPFLPGSPAVYRWEYELGYGQDSGHFVLMFCDRYFSMYRSDYIPVEYGLFKKIWDNTISYQVEHQDEGIDDEGFFLLSRACKVRSGSEG